MGTLKIASFEGLTSERPLVLLFYFFPTKIDFPLTTPYSHHPKTEDWEKENKKGGMCFSSGAIN